MEEKENELSGIGDSVVFDGNDPLDNFRSIDIYTEANFVLNLLNSIGSISRLLNVEYPTTQNKRILKEYENILQFLFILPPSIVKTYFVRVLFDLGIYSKFNNYTVNEKTQSLFDKYL